ncbi:hypothetical protein SLE2022_153860 [Rubroshorea leprosula]
MVSRKRGSLVKDFILLSVLLAAPTQNRCTAFVCSCYAPSRNFIDGGGEKEDGVVEEACNNEIQGQDRSNINGDGCSSTVGVRKSNLKKTETALMLEENPAKATEKRKVSWPDAHGKDIAHVQEFEPSVSEDGEIDGVRNSCVCAIQ